MKSKAMLYAGVGLFVIILLAGTCSAGFFIGQAYAPSSSATPPSLAETVPLLQITPNKVESTPEAGTPADLEQLFEPFWQSWNIVHDQYIDQPVDDEALMRGAIKGMMESLGDQHSSYMDPEQYKQANIPLEGEYEGIGAWVDPSGEFLTIVSPMPGSPAEKVGLKPGDEIIAVDGEDVTGIDGSLVIRRVLGPAGTTVKLTVRREGQAEPFDVQVTRANITIPSVVSKMLANNIAYVNLTTFGDKSISELRSTLKDLLAEKPVGLVLDLRNNPGGELSTAIEVASEFIGDGVIMYEEYGDGRRDTYTARKGGLATDIPLVVLINEGSASASEIVAGAIQDRQRGTLVGTTSFGKGSVQNWIPLKNNEGAVRVTIARWLTP
ncbi:MAG TPA: S41 family peptidase, partial [Anaerolineales bacterium]|nr:S41 family peptidase [Anaerolineales bacterium]